MKKQIKLLNRDLPPTIPDLLSPSPFVKVAVENSGTVFNSVAQKVNRKSFTVGR